MSALHEINIEGSKLSYLKSGNGKKILITFHGFGQNSDSFQPIEKAFPNYQFIHINLFFHGKSHLDPHHRPLSLSRWIAIFDAFLKHENITSFSLAGFSIGCRFIYSISQKYADRINNIFLLAPEGEKFNFWYGISVSVFPWLLKYFILHPHLFFSILQMMESLNIINKTTVKFAKSQMKLRSQRWQVMSTWLNFRLLKLSLKHWSNIINQHDISIQIMIGTGDYIVPAKGAINIQRQLQKGKLHRVKANHYNLIKKSAEYLYKFRNNPE
jgi:pimeloyl-ACP methyl ester carboxylesterase